LVELRRFIRTPIDAPVTFTHKSSAEVISGRAKDVSVGGMFIETERPASFGTEVTVRLRLPKSKDELTLPGLVRWVRDGGMGIQFGLLGAKETHEITEVVRRVAAGGG
jgi:uncharacterized protein (TIGR02266 family)